MACAAPPGHADHEYVICSGIKCLQLECIEGQTYTHICSFLFYSYIIIELVLFSRGGNIFFNLKISSTVE